MSIFWLSWRDFLTAKFITLSILPLVLSVAVLISVMMLGGSELWELLLAGAMSGEYVFFDTSSYPLVAKILSFEVVRYLISSLFYILSTFLVVILSVAIALLIAGFLTPIVTREINARHYNIAQTSMVGTSRVLWLMTTVIFKFLGILLLCLPFIFIIPILSFFFINIPFFYLYYKFLLIDVASNALSESKFELVWLEGGGFKFILACAVFYIISLVPLLGLFLQLFFIIFLTHIFYQKQTIVKF
ncbi:EI24 domain-containing protein [Campylobacter sp. faydin G-140]|uniref:EI24 domain-containing protein n=1 Tax=Campylobacter anatolicus TaxID=2829105 RepID=UPI001B9B6D11|nr:EI24 domain-containing protein [Campylobacter anatolicus]